MTNFEIRLVKKEEGMTSFSSLYPLKKEMGKGVKIGHAGTLDKFASGLMIVMIGNATRLNPVFSSFDKSYFASIKFGSETDTLDPEGEVIATSHVPDEGEIDYALSFFNGEIMQSPPIYSAIHIDGKRAYEIARKKDDIKMPLRPVFIYENRKISYTGGILNVYFHVSKGTYIRSLARDIAKKIGARAHLVKLERFSIGPFTLNDVDKLSSMEILEKTALFSTIMLDEKYKKVIDNGFIPKNAILSDTDLSKPYKFLYFDENLYAISSLTDGKIKIISRV